MSKFSAQVDAWTRKSLGRIEAVAKTASQELTEEVLVPRGKGGNMPVDTGFLRNSAHAAINRIPSGGSFVDGSDSAGQVVFEATVVTISQLQLGDRYYIGFTADYSRYMDAKYAFVRLAAQNWPQIVDRSVKLVRQQYDS